MNPDATKLYTQTFWNINSGFHNIQVFLKIVDYGFVPSMASVLVEAKELANSLATGKDFVEIFTEKDEGRAKALDTFGGEDGLASLAAASKMRVYRNSLAGAAVVFAHSILDGAAQDLLRTIALLAPTDFESMLSNRKVALSELRNTPYVETLQSKVDECVRAFERESLPSKCSRLFALCQPPESFEFVRNFKYDRARLETFDALRIDVVHGRGPKDVIFGEIELAHIKNTALHLMGLLNCRYDVKLSSIISPSEE